MKHRIFTKLLAAMLLAESVLQFAEPLHVHAAGDLRIEDYFPDAGFQAVLRQKYDTNHDGYLSSEERGVYNIYCEHEPSVRSLEGIEYFPEVRGIWCRDCNITSLDLRNNPEVTGVWCSENPITYLNLTENDKLEWVYCFKCELQTLNVSENPLLAYLECSDNPLTSIDLSNNKDLEHLIISSTQLSSLDVSNNRKLSHLDALKIGLTTLNLGNNPNMKRLDVWDNPGLDVDISGLSGLEFYNCANNDLTHLDVSHNPELMALYCDWNDIPSLDLSNNPRLVDLRCGCNLLHSLDLSHNPQLSYCQVFGNPLSELNISNNSRLKYVMEQADNGSIAKVYDGNSQSYDMLVEWGGSHEYMDWMQYFISIPTSTTIRMNAATREDVKDVYINTNDGLSGSEDFVTRGEAIQTLYEMAGRPNTGGSTRFTDVDGTFYADAVRWGEKNHICQGYPFIHSDEFGGDKPIARQDLALMVHRYAEYKGYLSAFDYGRTDNMDDFFDVDYYAWGAMTYAVQWKVVPTKGNHIYPHGRITTSELNQGLIEFLDHVNVGGSARVSTAGGSGTLTAEDKESRGYVNHTVDVGGGNGSGNNGNGGNISPEARQKMEDFVERMYETCLGRASDPDGKRTWVNELSSGRKTAVEIVRGFFLSPEYINSGKSNGQIVTDLYNAMLDRGPDPDGYRMWVEHLDHGQTTEAILAGFVGSSEFTALCREYGVTRGNYTVTNPRDKNYERTYFVYRLYQNCLNRTPDNAGLENWCRALENGDSGSEVAYGFVFSRELRDKHLSNTQYVDMLYSSIMGRNADAAGRETWVRELNNGASREHVFNGFLQSDEFNAQCRTAQISVGSPIAE